MRGKRLSDETGHDESLWRNLVARFLSTSEIIRSLQRVSGGLSGAVVVRVETNVRSYSLRGWPPKSFLGRRILELHRFLNFLSQHKLPVAVPLATSTRGMTLIESNYQFWQLEPWLPGCELDDQNICNEVIESSMKVLAKLHQVASQYQATEKGTEWFFVGERFVPAIVERINLIESWTERLNKGLDFSSVENSELRDIARAIVSHFQQVSGGIYDELKSLEPIRCPVFPCWRDLWNAHVLFEGNEVSGLIDACATRTDHPGTDLSRYLGSVFGDDDDRWNFALECYSHVRPLSDLDDRIIAALDRSSVLLSGLTWVDRFVAGNVSPRHHEMALARMTTIEKRMRNLSASRCSP